MQIYELTKPELDSLINLCNFTPDELKYFNQRSRHKSHIQIELDNYWSTSKVSSLSKSVRRKIKRIRKDF
ncbi:MAG: hypothetical protein NC299_15745 [Lachnospiraceae bacterium]|nr:hypothetical protein [Lachnospiraceae bacterium]